MTDPKTAAALQAITESIKPAGFQVAKEFNEDGTLEFTVYVHKSETETEAFTFTLTLYDVCNFTQALAVPFIRSGKL